MTSKVSDAAIEAGAIEFQSAHQNTCYPYASDNERRWAAEAIYLAMKAQEAADDIQRNSRIVESDGATSTSVQSPADGPTPWTETMSVDPAAEMARKLGEASDQSPADEVEIRQVLAWVDAQRRSKMQRSIPLNAIEKLALVAAIRNGDAGMREALERIAFGAIICADGSTRPMTTNRMIRIARTALDTTKGGG